MDQLPFNWAEPRDRAESDRRAHEGMDRAERNAPLVHGLLFWRVIEHLLRTRDAFTMDDFFELFDRHFIDQGVAPPAARDWTGAKVSAAYKRGILKKTGRTVKSARPLAHSKPLHVLAAGHNAADWLRARATAD